ncbi:MAG: molybdenum cofactor biosynthesis protein MoaE [Saprospiraceae bacterium]|nr:molybdenum cofactor biosynthesis protein MoaE [Saprospiraceae bacterium]
MAIKIQIKDQALDPSTCIGAVQDQACGGLALFIGTVRDQTRGRPVQHLEFEAYEPMALSEMEKIGKQITERWAANHVCIHHRTGRLQLGDIAVIIAVSTPHRKEAFEACQYAIDTLKETVPIWKKEIFEDGEVWVAAHP